MTSTSSRLSWAARAYRKTLAHYLNLIIPEEASLLEVGCGNGFLLQQLVAKNKSAIDLHERAVEEACRLNPKATIAVGHGASFVPRETPDYILLADTLNHVEDVQAVLENIRSYSKPTTRLVVSCYNTLWRPLLGLATWLGLHAPEPLSNWLSRHDLENLIELADWDVIREEARILCPVPVPVISTFLNRWVAPLLPVCCLTIIMVARPREDKKEIPKTVSVIIPARNESGNIAAAVTRTPEMGLWTELIFVEGNSTDETWKAIQQAQIEHPERRIKIAQQPGRGKGDAMRLGYALAEGEIVMILDADLTMPPEDLPKFYHAVANGSCEFANGSRLVYPMEEKAMQFCNLCANKIFGIIFSWLLGQQVKDTLCGTKVMTKENYFKIAAGRSYFGDFDPFGDFDLLFGASKLNLKIRDIPVRYRERTYGTTNITRWSAGMLLLRMICFAARKLKFV